MSDQEVLEFISRDHSVTPVFLDKLNRILDKIGYRLESTPTDVSLEQVRFRLKPLRQPPRCGPKCDHESGTHEVSPPAPPTTQMLVLYCGRVLVIESPEVMMVESLRFIVNDSVPKLINLPPGSVVREIK